MIIILDLKGTVQFMGQLAINIHNYIFQIDKVTYDGDVEIEDEQ